MVAGSKTAWAIGLLTCAVGVGCSGSAPPPGALTVAGAATPTTAAATPALTASPAPVAVAVAGASVAGPTHETTAGSPTTVATRVNRASVTGRRQASPAAAESPQDLELFTGAYTGFAPGTGAAVTGDPRDATRIYALEASGTLRILDAAGDPPRLVRSVPLFDAPVGSGRALGRLELLDGLAVLPTWGPGFEGVALFDPLTAASSRDVSWFDLSGLRASWPADARDSQGRALRTAATPLTRVTGAARADGALVLCFANQDAEGDHAPGALVAFELDAARRQLGAVRAMVRTSAFNPTGLARARGGNGDLLLVTCSGAFGQSGGAVDVVDPRTLARVSTIPFGAADPSGPVVIDAAARRGYVGSLAHARVHVLDLTGLTTGGARALPAISLPAQGVRSATSQVSLSADGLRLYASNEGESALYVIDLEGGGVRRVAGFARSGSPAAYEGLLRGFTIRSGSEGESLFTLTSDLVPADQAVPGVEVVVDRVAVRR